MKIFDRISKNFSKITIFVILGLFIYGSFTSRRWVEDKIIVHDVISYYAYLPASIIYNDLKFKFLDENINESVKNKVWTRTAPNNNKVLKMTMGNAICWLPAFLLTHGIVTLTKNWPNNGYSMPYSFAIAMSALLYLMLGLFFLRKLLLLFFSDYATGITLILVTLGTNLYFYTVFEPGMSHVSSFVLIIMFIYLIFKWLEKLTLKRAVLLGLVYGLIVLIRVSNAIVIVVPLSLILFNGQKITEKLNYLRHNLLPLFVFVFVGFSVVFLQLFYWKLITGTWLYNSYVPERFYFNNPHIIDGLFSYRKGWFTYTPIMIFGVFGMLVLWFKIPKLFYPILIFMIMNIYVINSWWCWWYGGSFGSRPMIDSYGIMALPIASFIDLVLSKKWWKRAVLFITFVFLIFLNQYQTTQYITSLLHYDSMTKELYWKIFLNHKWPQNYTELLKTPDYEKAMKGIEEK